MKIETLDHGFIDVHLPTQDPAGHLLALPALIDGHVHFRTPGATHKEDWQTGAKAALVGGVTTVFDMPNTEPPTTDIETLDIKKYIIDQQLESVGIPLRYKLWVGATPANARALKNLNGAAVGVKLYMGSTTGNLVVKEQADQEKIFRSAAEAKLVVAVHADDEAELQRQKAKFPNPTVEDHSRIRSCDVALLAVKRAIAMAKASGATLYLCHVSTAEEVERIAKAKREGVSVFAEVTPHHLFLDESAYATLGTLGQMNPPLRTADDREALWKGITDGVIDTISSDHAPHTLEEKAAPYPNSPSGVPGIETTLPLMLNAAKEGRITLEKIVELTRTNIQKIFHIPPNDDWVIVDLERTKEVKNSERKTKCGWSPFSGWTLTGWPVAVTIGKKLFMVNI